MFPIFCKNGSEHFSLEKNNLHNEIFISAGLSLPNFMIDDLTASNNLKFSLKA